MFATQSPLRSRLAAAWLAAALTAVAACGGGGGDATGPEPGQDPPPPGQDPPQPGDPPSGADRGRLTLAQGDLAVVNAPGQVVEFDLASARHTVRFQGIDPHGAPNGATAYLALLDR